MSAWIYRTLAVATLALLPALANAGGMDILRQRCAECHDLKGPPPQRIAVLKSRQGPDFFYAGNKYRKAWLVAWMQNPNRIRPAGMYYRNHIKVGPDHDVIDQATLKPHLVLSKVDATSVADALMTLKANQKLVDRETFKPAPNDPMGEMAFEKFYSCVACHEIEPGYGGLSGPELYTAGRRLQPKFMLSFIRSPQAWDPKSMMPNGHVPEEGLQQLVNFIIDLSKEDQHAAQ